MIQLSEVPAATVMMSDDDDGVTAGTISAAAAVPSSSGACVNVADRYEKLGRVGSGTYGVVYKARDVLTGTTVALKRCIPHHEASDGVSVTTLREIENLRLCAACPYTVSLLAVAVSKSSVFLVFEYCEHDLADLIDEHYLRHGKNKRSPFTEEAVKTLLRHLLSALTWMHSHSLIHRDVKLSNLLYCTTANTATNTTGGMLKLADFGLSRHYCSTTTTATTVVLTPKVASLWYRPPELLLGCRSYTQSIDLWAAGCAWAELLTGQPAMPGKNELDQLQRIFDSIGVPDLAIVRDYPLVRNGSVKLPTTTTTTTGSGHRKFRILEEPALSVISESGCQLLVSMLQWQPDQRWTAEQALRSPYLTTEHPLPLPERQMPRFF